jgi:hypothetical protein
MSRLAWWRDKSAGLSRGSDEVIERQWSNELNLFSFGQRNNAGRLFNLKRGRIELVLVYPE